MHWPPPFVFFTFSAVFTLGCLCTYLVGFNLVTFKRIVNYNRRSIYSAMAYHVSALGCLWYKLWLSRAVITHGIIQSIALFLYFYGLQQDYKDDKNFTNRQYGAVFCLSLVAFQYCAGVLAVFSTITGSRKLTSLVSGFHAYGGACVFIISSYYNSLVYCNIRHENNEFKYSLRLLKTHEYALFFMVCATYLILNPYYDWRRMKKYTLEEVGSDKKPVEAK